MTNAAWEGTTYIICDISNNQQLTPDIYALRMVMENSYKGGDI